MSLAAFAWCWTVESRPRQTLPRHTFPSRSSTSMVRSRPSAMMAAAASMSFGMPSLPMRSLPRPPAMTPNAVSVSTSPAATERAIPSPPRETTRSEPCAAKSAASCLAWSALVLLTNLASSPCSANAVVRGSIRLSTAPLRALGLRMIGTVESAAFMEFFPGRRCPD